MLESFRLRDFRWFWLSTFTSYMAFGMQIMVRGWLVLRLSNDSPFALSIVMASYTLPATIMSFIGGVLADRLPKKYILIVSQATNICVTAILATLDLTGLVHFWQVVVLSVISGSMDAINLPSRATIISELVPPENILNAVSLSNSSNNLTRIIGPALAGMLIVIIDTAGVFFFISACYLLSVVFVKQVKLVSLPIDKEPKTIFRDISNGLKYVSEQPTMCGLICIIPLPLFFGFSIQNLLPAWAREALNVQSQGLGMLMMAMGIGALTGTLLLAACQKLKKRWIWMLCTAIFWGIAMAFFAKSTSYLEALPLLFLTGVFMATHTSLHMTLMQVYSSPEMRGRMMSLVVLTFGLTPISALPFGALAEKIGTPNTLCLSGILLSVSITVLAVVYPKLRLIE